MRGGPVRSAAIGEQLKAINKVHPAAPPMAEHIKKAIREIAELMFRNNHTDREDNGIRGAEYFFELHLYSDDAQRVFDKRYSELTAEELGKKGF